MQIENPAGNQYAIQGKNSLENNKGGPSDSTQQQIEALRKQIADLQSQKNKPVDAKCRDENGDDPETAAKAAQDIAKKQSEEIDKKIQQLEAKIQQLKSQSSTKPESQSQIDRKNEEEQIDLSNKVLKEMGVLGQFVDEQI